MAKRIINTQKQLEESFTQKLQDLSNEKCKITAELAQRAADLRWMQRSTSPQVLRPWRSSSFLLKTSRRTRRISGSKNRRKQMRRCTTKTQPPEEIDLEPPDPTQGPSQASQVEKLAPPDIKNLIAHTDSSSFGQRGCVTCISRGSRKANSENVNLSFSCIK